MKLSPNSERWIEDVTTMNAKESRRETKRIRTMSQEQIFVEQNLK
jgi:hypothetical protein